MAGSSASDLLKLIEKMLGCKVRAVDIADSGGIILRTCGSNLRLPKITVSEEDISADIYTDIEIKPDAEQISDLKRLIRIFSYSPSETAAARAVASSDVLEAMTASTSIDIVLHQIVTGMVENGGFRRVGIMLLNEALLELRGMIYCNQDMKIDVTSFRNAKLTFRTKNKFSDVMFFGSTLLISADTVEGFDDLRKYFCGNMMVTGLGIGGRPIGVLIVCKEHYSRADRESVKIFGNICTLSIEFYKTKKELALSKSELSDVKKDVPGHTGLMNMGRVSVTVAHELKTPLAAISGFVSKMEKTRLNPETQKYVSIVQSELARLGRIVRDILAYSGKTELRCENICLAEVIRGVMPLIESSADISKIDIVINISDGLYIYVDWDKFSQVLINIIGNAVQEMPGGGTLTVSAAETSRRITVNIADTGGGIPEDIKDMIFEPFFTRKRNGTGLGLPLCRKIMQEHGGDIFVSNTDMGAVFTLLLPKRG